MSRPLTTSTQSPPDQEPPQAPGRFGVRAVLGLVALLVGAVPFLALWLLVQESWSPLASLDGEVAADLNEAVSGSSVTVSVLRAVTDLGGTGASVLVTVLATLFLLVRRHRRLAAYVAVTGIGLPVLILLTKYVADRARPVVLNPVVETPSNQSFPSGHAMTAVVTWGVLLLVLLPVVSRRVRPWLIALFALLVFAIGFTRLALGVHFVSDVLAGWALGAAWLAITTIAFRGWQHDRHEYSDEPLDPLEVDPAEAPHPAPTHQQVLPAGRTTVLQLAGAAAALLVGLVALGLLVTRVLEDTALGRFDRSAAAWFVDQRTETLTTVAETVGALSGTPMVIAVGLSLCILSLAWVGSWRPVVFVLVVIAGEVGLYYVIGLVVGRVRPDVVDLTEGLPTGAAWPSGHAAAAVAIYGALAALVIGYGVSRWRWAVLAVPVLLAPAIGVSRVYVAAHFPTDVVAGLLLGTLWVLVCAWAFQLGSGRGLRHPATGLTTASRA
ncbi:phosphatase PAP2 family protein [Modestobacter sp. VKM Ac-2977]|uniref:phosphatase PAP2 family protein n=1 Tax=Modestobacter sp. VKM Ac-2977 TaxID=3004131 RepID=UPI0022AA8973|nr:phosphatase PAP2 family protein [Modestobacter sp. VKM Ac-2977]MCZ2821259.1 phosphatase PAP2 family protein [Modestobacter sp. VKM Ac-2977]